MHIEAQKVVSIHYTLKDDAGNVIDTSVEQDPLTYVHGTGMLVEGLEKELTAKKVGEKFSVSVPPALGYGDVRSELVQKVSRADLANIEGLEVDMILESETTDGVPIMLRVVEIGTEDVTLDANHPLAGATLHFDIAVEHIRDLTPEEIKEGSLADS